MPTRAQVLKAATASAAAGLAGSGLWPRLAFSAREAHQPLSEATRFTSNRPPSLSITVPAGWFGRADVVDGMSVPWSLAFASTQYVPQDQPQSGDWDSVVVSALDATGLAVAFLAYDQLVPASSWLQGAADQVLTRAGINIGRPGAVGRPFPPRLQLTQIIDQDDKGAAGPQLDVAWFDAGHYVVGVEVWRGPDADASALDPLLASVQVRGE